MKTFYLACCLGLLLSSQDYALAADTAPWRITAQQGTVRIAAPSRPASAASPNQVVPVGSTVTTGANSGATVDNGLQRITMSANSRMRIASDSASAMTRIFQDVGVLLFKIDRRDRQHFRVETPLLAAVVKGTTFTVTTDPKEDRVAVSEGLVEVQGKAGGNSFVPAGGKVTILADEPKALKLAGTAIDMAAESGRETPPPVEKPVLFGDGKAPAAQNVGGAGSSFQSSPSSNAPTSLGGLLDAAAIIAALLATAVVGRGILSWLSTRGDRSGGATVRTPSGDERP